MHEYFDDATHDDFVELIESVVDPKLHGTEIDDPSEIQQYVQRLGLPELLESQIIGTFDVAVYDIIGKRRGHRSANY